jgi:hypothetical protein
MSRLAFASLPILLLAGLLGPLEGTKLCATAEYMPHTATHNVLKYTQVGFFFSSSLMFSAAALYARFRSVYQLPRFNTLIAPFFWRAGKGSVHAYFK